MWWNIVKYDEKWMANINVNHICECEMMCIQSCMVEIISIHISWNIQILNIYCESYKKVLVHYAHFASLNMEWMFPNFSDSAFWWFVEREI